MTPDPFEKVTYVGKGPIAKLAANISKLASFQASEFWRSPEGTACLELIKREARKYWKDNIYRTFNARISSNREVSGQLGNSLDVVRRGDHITAVMKPIYHATTGGGVSEYGQYLRRGTGRSAGRYVPEIDRRLRQTPDSAKDIGWHPGVSTSYWEKWMTEFRPVFRSIVHKAFKGAFRKYMTRTTQRR